MNNTTKHIPKEPTVTLSESISGKVFDAATTHQSSKTRSNITKLNKEQE